MSTASVQALPLTPTNAISHWLQTPLKRLRAATTPAQAPAAPPSSANRQEAQKLRALARDMMRIDGGSAANLFAAADRCEFGYRA